jgi:hypothetical protein
MKLINRFNRCTLTKRLLRDSVIMMDWTLVFCHETFRLMDLTTVKKHQAGRRIDPYLLWKRVVVSIIELGELVHTTPHRHV